MPKPLIHAEAYDPAGVDPAVPCDLAGQEPSECHLAEQSTPPRNWLQIIPLWIARRRQQKALEELALLDGRLLRDIGLSRAKILSEAARPFWAPSQPPSTRK
jgi:uncharacterized protein YjiS (DUF1127 family)